MKRDTSNSNSKPSEPAGESIPPHTPFLKPKTSFAQESILDFTVPLLPPSVNNYVRHTRAGGHYVTEEATAFMDAVPICARQKQVRFKYYAIEIYLTLGPKRKLDLDNAAKVVLDGLRHGGQIHSDGMVTLLCLHKKRGVESSTQITVWEGKKP